MTKQTLTLTKTEIWATEDGINFSKKGDLPSLQPTISSSQMKVAILNGKIFLLAFDFSGTRKLWKSEDGGATWTVVLNLTTVFGGNDSLGKLISFNGSLYVVGYSSVSANDTLRSDDEGVNWYVVAPSGELGVRTTTGDAFLGGKTFLYYQSNYNHHTSDFATFTGFTNRTPIDVTRVCSSSTALFAMVWDGNGQQIYKSTDGITFSKLTAFVYGDEEYGITESLPPNMAFMDSGNCYVFECNNRLYFIHPANKGVMSAPSSDPTNLRTELNSTIPTPTMAWTTGDVTAPSNLPISATADFSGVSSLSASATIDTGAQPLTSSANFAGASSFSVGNGVIVNVVYHSGSATFTGISSLGALAEVVLAEVTRGGTIRLNGTPQVGMKVYAIRASDDTLFTLTTDSQGKYVIPDVAGVCHVVCVYKDGQNDLYSALAQPYVAVN